jgi:hypothetical protein
MVWKSNGYLSLTKDKRKVLVTVKRVRYVVHLEEARDVLDGKRAFALVLEYLKD